MDELEKLEVKLQFLDYDDFSGRNEGIRQPEDAKIILVKLKDWLKYRLMAETPDISLRVWLINRLTVKDSDTLPPLDKNFKTITLQRYPTLSLNNTRLI